MIIGCYGYRALCGVTVIHVFADGAVECGCKARRLRR